MRHLLIRLGIIAAVLSLSLVASPVAGFEVLRDTGLTGDYTVTDEVGTPGVVCKYEDHIKSSDEELDRIRIRSITTKGPRARKRWVGYRFLIVRKSPASAPDYKIIFKSKILKARASKTHAVSFPSRRWTPPENLATSDYRVVIDLKYYKKGSKTKLGGKVRGAMEVYRHKHPSEPNFDSGQHKFPGLCAHNFFS